MSKLTDGLVDPKSDPTLAAMDTQASPQLVPPEAGDGLVPVYLTNAVATSTGPGPGVVRIPRDEANRIISRKLGVAGTQPPKNFLDGGQPGPVSATRTFR